MRRQALAALVLAVGAVITGSASPAQQAPQLTCKYGFKYVTKVVHGHKKRVKICKKKAKPKPPPPQADLELEMRSTLDQITAGNRVSYSFIVENKGPQIADETTLTVDLPPGDIDVYGYGGTTDTNGCNTDASATGNHIACSFGSLAAESDEGGGGSPYGFLSVRVETRHAGDYTVAATAKASTADPTPANASVTKPFRVLAGPPSADLSVSLLSSPTPATVPEGFTETVSVTNHGPTEATEAYVSVLLPQGATATQPIPSDTDLFTFLTTFCPIYGYGGATTAFVCFGSIGSGQSATATLNISPSIRSPATLRTDAVVSSYTRDPNLANNRGSDETGVTPFAALPGADVRLAFDQPPSAIPGNPLYLPFRLSNLGHGDADQLTVEASTNPPIPNLALELQTSIDSGIGCASTDSSSVSCQLTELDSDARVTGALYGDSVAAGSYTATVTVRSAELSPGDEDDQLPGQIARSRVERLVDELIRELVVLAADRRVAD